MKTAFQSEVADGVFNKDQIAYEYFITEIDGQLIPQHNWKDVS